MAYFSYIPDEANLPVSLLVNYLLQTRQEFEANEAASWPIHLPLRSLL